VTNVGAVDIVELKFGDLQAIAQALEGISIPRERCSSGDQRMIDR
jgi:hypothetical protein